MSYYGLDAYQTSNWRCQVGERRRYKLEAGTPAYRGALGSPKFIGEVEEYHPQRQKVQERQGGNWEMWSQETERVIFQEGANDQPLYSVKDRVR